MIDRLSDKYFEKLGKPKPGLAFNIIDYYRFKLAYNFLLPGSVLDVGTYFGDFLKEVLLKDPKREVYGTEINQQKKVTNKNLQGNIVRVDFRNGSLSTFEDRSVDNVVCAEVIEHIPNIKYAIKELCRVAKKRVIITVSFKEKIRYHLCIYCQHYTPNNGHLHSFNYGSFKLIIPYNCKITEEFSFDNKIVCSIAKKLPLNNIFEFLIEAIDYLFSHINSERNRWLFIVIDKEKMFEN